MASGATRGTCLASPLVILVVPFIIITTSGNSPIFINTPG
jgi:hypothetical protein